MTMPSATVNDNGLKNSLAVSGVLHLLVFLLLYFGLPHLMPPLPDPHPPVSFQIVEIADLTTTRTKDEEPKPPEPQPEPPKPPQAQTQPAPTPPTPPEKLQPVAEALKPAPVPKSKPLPPKTANDDFSKLLKNLETKKQPVSQPSENKAEAKPQAAAQTQPLSEFETRTLQDAIRSQIQPCWNMPIGARDAQNLVVEMGMDLNPDGTVIATDIIDKSRYASDSFFRAAADAAVRAVRNPACSPLKLPADKYDAWKHINYVFDPRDML